MADGQGHQWIVMSRWDEICNEILDLRKLPHEFWSDRIFSLIYSIKIQWWDVQHFLKHKFNYLWAAKNVMLRSRTNLTSIITESLSSSGSLPIEPKAPRSKMFHRCIQVISELLPAWVTICHKPFLTQKHLFPWTKKRGVRASTDLYIMHVCKDMFKIANIGTK